jgi:hypothetical protein
MQLLHPADLQERDHVVAPVNLRKHLLARHHPAAIYQHSTYTRHMRASATQWGCPNAGCHPRPPNNSVCFLSECCSTCCCLNNSTLRKKPTHSMSLK